MKIKEITSQYRRDFDAIYECEHCNHELTQSGYDDTHFHQNVIPSMICPKCNKTSPKNYRALAPKYQAEIVI